MVLKHLKKVVVRHVPTQGSRAAREFLAQTSAPKARSSNPDCIIENKMCSSGESYIDVTYKNDTSERIPCGDLTAQAIMAHIRMQTSDLETLAALKAAGLAGVQLHSNFGSGNGSQAEHTGSSSKVMPL